jgi:serine/threonine protein kinase
MGVCKSEGSVMLVQEYVSGGSLHKILQNKSIELLWPARVKMALEIAQALLFLHSRNILHRDLKAENVLIEAAEVVAGRPQFGRCKVR